MGIEKEIDMSATKPPAVKTFWVADPSHLKDLNRFLEDHATLATDVNVCKISKDDKHPKALVVVKLG